MTKLKNVSLPFILSPSTHHPFILSLSKDERRDFLKGTSKNPDFLSVIPTKVGIQSWQILINTRFPLEPAP